MFCTSMGMDVGPWDTRSLSMRSNAHRQNDAIAHANGASRDCLSTHALQNTFFTKMLEMLEMCSNLSIFHDLNESQYISRIKESHTYTTPSNLIPQGGSLTHSCGSVIGICHHAMTVFSTRPSIAIHQRHHLVPLPQ